METADQILPRPRVHSGFSADGAVYHSQQRCWNLDMRDAAMINRGYESRNVANHSATKTHNKRLAVKSRRDHPVANRARSLKRLRFLAGRNREQRGVKSG